ncbi:MAG: hypothetical protein FJ206_11505 [Gemmatimonadetes bacterium]|nr:hypothetical protein [Gemmatimonadota bacterium]
MTLGRAAVLAALASFGPGQAASQEPQWRYLARHLECALFQETIRTKVRGESGGAIVEDRAGREAILAVTARDSSGDLAVEAWFDSLSVWRETSAGRETPDADGVLGGRYRGSLSPGGRYHGAKTPFIPADVADVADLSQTLSEFFPRLPGGRLTVGGTWRDSTGLEIRRPDADRRGGQSRLEWTWNRRRSDRAEVTDTLAVTVEQMIRETGDLVWSDRLGPLTWNRRLVITAKIPTTGGVRRSITSTIQQEISVVRLVEREPCR